MYGADAVQEQRKRYTDLIDEFEKKYGTNRTLRLYSAPGRTEIGGNHSILIGITIIQYSILWSWESLLNLENRLDIYLLEFFC